MIKARTIYIVKNEKGIQNYATTVEGENYTELYQKEKEKHIELLEQNEYAIKIKTYYSYELCQQ